MVVVLSRFSAAAPAAGETCTVRLGEFAGIGVRHAPKSPIVRDAVPGDAEALLSIWMDFTSDPPRQPRPTADADEVRRSVGRIAEDPTQRLVVAVAGG